MRLHGCVILGWGRFPLSVKIDPSGAGQFSHGNNTHETVIVDAYNSELKDSEGFIGDRASKRAFLSILEKRREQNRKVAEDPLGPEPTEELRKKELEKVLLEGDLEAAGLVHGAIEEFAQQLSAVAHRLLKLKAWKDTERIVVGGGFSFGKVGELAIQRAAVLLRAEHGDAIEMIPIRHHPDEAGLLGNIHVVPRWMFRGYDSLLAVDIGGSNIRVGVVRFNLDKDTTFKQATVHSSELWRHADDTPTREGCITRLAEMLGNQIKEAGKAELTLAPLVGIGCPGLIKKDGSIEKGGQNLPGNWESSRFNLPRSLRELIPAIGGSDTMIAMHNDAVVQGLSETPWMNDVTHWAVLTIGTGLGNAHFTNRETVADTAAQPVAQSAAKPRKAAGRSVGKAS